jgi:hypothetical protein
MEEERPVAAAVVQVGTTVSVSLLAALWASISSLMSAAGGLLGGMPLRFLGQLLHMWGAPSSVGLQALLQKLQLVGSGVYVAPPELERYRQIVQQLGWVTMKWTRKSAASWASPVPNRRPCRSHACMCCQMHNSQWLLASTLLQAAP